jgi:hypothetical protein
MHAYNLRRIVRREQRYSSSQTLAKIRTLTRRKSGIPTNDLCGIAYNRFRGVSRRLFAKVQHVLCFRKL